MNTRSFRSLATKYKVPLGIIEKDFVLTNLLSAIASFPQLSNVTFKGGTAIKKIYFQDFRFSEDLDFVCSDSIAQDFKSFIENAVKDLDVNFTGIKKTENKTHSFKFKIQYKESSGHTTSVRVDLSKREDIIQAPLLLPVLHFYDTFHDTFSIPTMSLEEIMAEKIRALMYTVHARHLYDVWFLHCKNIKINSRIVSKKIQSVYHEDFDANELKNRLSERKKLWFNELTPFLAIVPSFEMISKTVSMVISNAMLNE